MIRGTTAKFKFQLPYPFSSLAGVKVVFWQEETKTVIIKKLENCSQGDSQNELCVSLCPEETLKFSESYKAKAQLKGDIGAFDNSMSFASKEYLITVDPIYKGSDIDDWEIFTPESREIIFDGGEIGGES